MSSSNILDLQYDSHTQELTVLFMAGGKHIYSDVPYHKYESMLKAKSKGTYFNQEIKDKHESKKIY